MSATQTTAPLRNYPTGESPRCLDTVVHIESGRVARVSGVTAQGHLLVRREGAKRTEWFWTDELRFVARGGVWAEVAS